MFCPKCGREIPDGSVCPCSYEQPLLSANPAVNAIKSSGSSSLVLAALILGTVTRLVSVLTSIVGVFDGTGYFHVTVEGIVDPGMIGSAMNAGRIVGIFIMLLAFTPAVLMTIGMWMHYATCRDRFNGNISTGGLTLCKVTMIVSIVFAGLLILATLFYLVMVFAFSGTIVNMFSYMIESGEYGYGYGLYDGITADMMSSILVILCFVLVVILAVLVLMICYYSSALKLLNRMKASANSGIPDARISRFLIGMMYVSAVVSGLIGLFMLFDSPIAGLCSIGGAVSLILLAVALGRLRQQMTILLYPPVQPVYMPVQPVQEAVPGEYGQPVAPAAPAVPEQPVVSEQPAPAPVPQEPQTIPEQPAPAPVPQEPRTIPEQPAPAPIPQELQSAPEQPAAEAPAVEPASEEKTEE